MLTGPFGLSQTRELLATLDHRPVHKLGQNFLVDGNIVRKSLELAEVKPGDIVVEVGPGLGTLTTTLLGAGATVYAVEADPRLAQHLRDRVAPDHPGRFHLLEGDAMDHPLAGYPARLSDPGRELRFVEGGVLVDVEIAHLLLPGGAGRYRDQRSALEEGNLHIAVEAVQAEEPSLVTHAVERRERPCGGCDAMT